MKTLNVNKSIMNKTVSGAIYDFMAFLTARNQTITVGSSEVVSPILDAFKEWSKNRGLSDNDANVQNWTDKI